MIFVVSVDFPYNSHLPPREVFPPSVECDTFKEAAGHIENALALGLRVMVEVADVDDEAGPADPDLVDWPAERHVRVFG